MFLYVVLTTCFVNTLAIDYLDKETVIIRRLPTGDEGALFGYSAVLHSVDASGGIDNMRYTIVYYIYTIFRAIFPLCGMYNRDLVFMESKYCIVREIRNFAESSKSLY